MTRDEWDKIEKVPGKRFLFRRRGTARKEPVGTGAAISYFKYSVRLKLKESADKWSIHHIADEQFSCEQVEEADQKLGTRMVRKFLEETAKAQRRAANAREEWLILQEASYGVGSPKLAERVQNSHQSDISEAVARLEAAEAYADETKITADKMAAVARRLISFLGDPDGEAVLRRRYIYGMKWETIAETMNYSYKGIWKVHDRAVFFLENVPEAKLYIKVHAPSVL